MSVHDVVRRILVEARKAERHEWALRLVGAARLALHQDNPKLRSPVPEPYVVDDAYEPPKEVVLDEDELTWLPTSMQGPKRVPKDLVQLDFVQRDKLKG